MKITKAIQSMCDIRGALEAECGLEHENGPRTAYFGLDEAGRPLEPDESGLYPVVPSDNRLTYMTHTLGRDKARGAAGVGVLHAGEEEVAYLFYLYLRDVLFWAKENGARKVWWRCDPQLSFDKFSPDEPLALYPYVRFITTP